MPQRNNNLNHFSRYNTSKKCLTDFIDSFDKLKEILDERARESSKIQKENLEDLDDEVPFAHVDDDQNNDQKNTANQKDQPIRLETENIPGDQNMTTIKDENIVADEEIGKQYDKQYDKSYENDEYSLGKDVRCLIDSLEQCKNKNVPIRDLLEYYTNIDKIESNLINKYNRLSKDKKKDKKSEHLNNLYLIINCKKILRAEIGKIFVRMTSESISILSEKTGNLENLPDNQSGNQKYVKNMDLLIDLRENFLPLFTPKELYSLYLSFLSLRRKKMVIYFSEKLSFFLIRQLIEKEITNVWLWFSGIIKMDVSLQNGTKPKDTELKESKPKDSVDDNFLKKPTHNLDFNTLTGSPSNELQVLRFFIYSLVRKSVCQLNENELKKNIQILNEEMGNIDCKHRLLSNIMLKDVLKEIRDKRLEKQGILEL